MGEKIKEQTNITFGRVVPKKREFKKHKPFLVHRLYIPTQQNNKRCVNDLNFSL